MFSNDFDFDIDEDFLKDVFKSADEQAVLKRSSPQPQETVSKKLRVGDIVPNPIPEEEPRAAVGSLPSPSDVPSSSRKVQASESTSLQRKFPGPAGLLPDRGGCLNRSLEAQHDSEDDSEMPPQELCSQPARSVFQSEAWLQAQQDLGLVGPAKSALAACTLRWVRGKALAGQLPNLRVPFLLVALRNIDFSLQDPFVLVHDPTGQMTGTLHREVREAHETRLRPGTVLVLRQVGILTTRRTLRNYYLNITANNVVSIYHAPDQQQPSIVEVVRVQEISLLEVAQNIRDIQERRLTIDLPAAHLLDCHEEQLFSTVGSPVVPRPLLAGHPGGHSSRLHARNSVSQVQSTVSADKLGTSNCAIINVSGRALDRTPSLVSKFPVTQNSNIRPHHVPLHNGVSKVVSNSTGTGSTSAVAPSQRIQNCGVSGAQGRLLGHEQTNMLPENEAVPRNIVSTRGFGFKPKTSQLSNLGSTHIANGFSSGSPLGDSTRLPNDQCTVKEMQCSLNAVVNLDDERRIVENVLDSIDPSQLFDEDF